MQTSKTIEIPLEDLERAQSVGDLKKLLRRFFLEWRRTYEKVFEALQTKQDKS